jgi:alkanesulfonate monooxygenase SsuD/methylene tetrahydromethanopterin reductase-like flavin-dependent oxidoreductase (luciferase family)
MRSVFVTDSTDESTRVRAALEHAVPSSMRPDPVSVDDWAIVGDRHYVRDKLAEYVERLKLTYLIVRAGIEGVSEVAQLRSQETVLNIIEGL